MKKRISATIDEETEKIISGLLKKKNYRNKSHVIEDAIKNLKNKNQVKPQQIFFDKERYPLVQLIESVCDDYKAIIQAAWCGSYECIRELVTADKTNKILLEMLPKELREEYAEYNKTI